MDAIAGLRLSSILPANLPNLELPAGGVQTASIPTDKLNELGPMGAARAEAAPTGRAFSDFLGDMVRDVNAKQAAAGDAVQGVLAGETVPLHNAMLAIEEASVSFQLMVEVRNKLMESYQELMRMQI